MRLLLLSLLGSLLLLGCASPRPAADSAEAKPAEKPIMTPVHSVVGTVVLVNGPLRFVVIEFPNGHLPAADDRLGVYRKGQKVGEVRISSHTRNQNTAADIMAGEAREGDMIRQE